MRNIIDDVTELTEGQQDTISTIANGCPYAGGEAVYLARALLNDGAYYHDSLLCIPPSPIKRPAQAAEPDAFKVYPNPSKGFALVALKEPAEASGEILLSNALGIRLLSVPFVAGDKSLLLEFENLPAGIYYVTVSSVNHRSTKMITHLK